MSDKPYFRSTEELAQYQKITAMPEHKALVEFRNLFVSYATKQGGLTLEVWRLFKGYWFGEPQSMSLKLVAGTLGIPYSDVTRIVTETCEAVAPRYEALDLQPGLARSRRGLVRYLKKHRG
jgi:hypothetical protein